MGCPTAQGHCLSARHRRSSTPDDFAIACPSRNSRRGDKPLEVHVTKQGIARTVAPVIKAYLERHPYQSAHPRPRVDRRPPGRGVRGTDGAVRHTVSRAVRAFPGPLRTGKHRRLQYRRPPNRLIASDVTGSRPRPRADRASAPATPRTPPRRTPRQRHRSPRARHRRASPTARASPLGSNRAAAPGAPDRLRFRKRPPRPAQARSCKLARPVVLRGNESFPDP